MAQVIDFFYNKLLLMNKLPNNSNKADEEPQAPPPMPMKTCPFCGEQILAIAKKCKYCGEWLDRSYTLQQEKGARKQEATHGGNLPPDANTDHGTAKVCMDYAKTMALTPEIIVLSIFVGFITERWWAFVVSLVVLFAMLQIRFFSKKFLRVLLWVMWGGVLLWLIYFCMVGLLAAAMLGD